MVQPGRSLESSHASTSIPTTGILSALPTELVQLVLRFCDPATLAQTSLASLALLELASPILYHDVHARGVARIGDLLCSRATNASPHLSARLSLHQIQHLTLSVQTDSSWAWTHRSPPMFSQARIDGGQHTLLLSSLTLFLPSTRWAAPATAYDNWPTFLHWFSPTVVNLIHRPPTNRFRPLHRVGNFGPFHIDFPTWPRMNRIAFEGFGDDVDDRMLLWSCLPGRTDIAVEDVTVVFAAALGRTESVAAALLALASPLLEPGHERAKEIVVETVDYWDEEKVERCLDLAWGTTNLAQEEATRRRGMIRFEAVDIPFADLYPKHIGRSFRTAILRNSGPRDLLLSLATLSDVRNLRMPPSRHSHAAASPAALPRLLYRSFSHEYLSTTHSHCSCSTNDPILNTPEDTLLLKSTLKPIPLAAATAPMSSTLRSYLFFTTSSSTRSLVEKELPTLTVDELAAKEGWVHALRDVAEDPITARTWLGARPNEVGWDFGLATLFA